MKEWTPCDGCARRGEENDWVVYAVVLPATGVPTVPRWLCGDCARTASRAELAATLALADAGIVLTGQFARAVLIRVRMHTRRIVRGLQEENTRLDQMRAARTRGQYRPKHPGFSP